MKLKMYSAKEISKEVKKRGKKSKRGFGRNPAKGLFGFK